MTPPAAATAVEGAAGAGVTHTVMVGGAAAGLTFQPAEMKAAIGDTVVFNFLSMNHSATQSAFDTPCDPMEGGMDSGFQPNPNNSVNPPPQVAMQVMVDTPLCESLIPPAGRPGIGVPRTHTSSKTLLTMT